MNRLSIDDYFCTIATVVALRSTCTRRAVGCVLINYRNQVIATGYNGAAHGRPHCIDSPCPGAPFLSGLGLELCEAIHAEQNALLQCPDVTQIRAAYCTTAPCIHCVKLLSNTACTEIVYIQPYGEARPDMWPPNRYWRQHKNEYLDTALRTRRLSGLIE